jgi:gamma-glutamyltranspeptidase/glutathione hydrolase
MRSQTISMIIHFGWDFKYASRRMPVLAENVVATSQPLACQAGIKMLLNGGNAVDAAIATAITLTVVEPVNNGIGSDAFALIWDGKSLKGLNASGRSPAAWTPEYFSHRRSMPILGWDATTIPGAVSAWVKLSNKYGQLSFDKLFEPAIRYAEKGFFVSPITAEIWSYLAKMYKKRLYPEFYETFMINGKPPSPGQLFKCPAQAETLKKIAQTKGESFYSGELAKKIISHSENTGGVITLQDLENHKATWEKSLSMDYKGVSLHEIPPNGQGITTLIMLGILKHFNISEFDPDSPEAVHIQLEAMKLAFSDAYRYISDISTLEFDPEYLLDNNYLKQRASEIDPAQAKIFKHGIPKEGDTVYLTTADEDGMMVSYIQSNYMGFGSGIVIPGTGISLQNRGNGFTLIEGHPNQVGPNKRPFHTIIPGFVTQKGRPVMSFGVMGGEMQPQGQAQMMIRIFEYGQNPQTALDAPRWKVINGVNVKVESEFDKNLIKNLTNKGHSIKEDFYFNFGGGQIIHKMEGGYLAASDPRKDGQAMGY